MARTKAFTESAKMPSKKALARQARESLRQTMGTDADVTEPNGGGLGDAPKNQREDYDVSREVDRMMAAMEDRRHNHIAVREKLLEAFLFDLKHRCYADGGMELDNDIASLSQKLLRFACRADTTKERILCLQTFMASVLIWPTVTFLDDACDKLKGLIIDDQDDQVKRHAIYALTAAIANPEASDRDMASMLAYLTAISESGGTSVSALASSTTVVAAMQSWAFLASHMDDFQDSIEPALDAFLGQLAGSDPEAQGVAGRCIAFIFEESRLREVASGTPYTILVSEDEVLARLNDTISSNKRQPDLRKTLGYVVTSIERHVGPYFSTAVRVTQHHTSKQAQRSRFIGATPQSEEGTWEGHGLEYGLRKTVRISNAKVCTVNTWELDFKLEMLQVALGSGYIYHISHNEVVSGRLERVDGLDEDEFPRMRRG